MSVEWGLWGLSVGLALAGSVLLVFSIGQISRHWRDGGGLLITRRRASDRAVMAMMLVLAAWVVGSGVLLYRQAALADATRTTLQETAHLLTEVAALKREFSKLAIETAQARIPQAGASAQSEPPPSPPLPAAAKNRASRGRVNTGMSGKPLLIRNGPQGAVIAELTQGTELEVSEDQSRQVGGRNWLYVRAVNGQTGWVASNNIELLQDHGQMQ